MSNLDPRGAIGFAEKVLELLDEGRYTATYKYAVLLALIDLSLEGTLSSGAPPDMVTTRQLAGKVVELYWPHTIPFASRSPALVLRQNTVGQAEIVSAIRRFREQHSADPSVPHWESRSTAPAAYERLVKAVERKLIEMPLPRLQTMGGAQREFIYRIHWDASIQQREVDHYLRGAVSTFDNRVLLLPGVGEYFVQLSGLLRPLIQRHWAAMVAQVNRLEESQLEVFLFGADRTPTARVRAGLWEFQGKRCFYCDARLADPTRAEVDHFVPWSRYPDDGLDNFVVADKTCNGNKCNSLAADAHLGRWTRRFAAGSAECAALDDLAVTAKWARDHHRSLNVARAIYPRLPEDARLWLRGTEFIPPDTGAIAAALAIDTKPGIRLTEKAARLLAIARLRQSTRWPGYMSIADYHGGAYECDFVSPYTKTAGNVDAHIMVLLQDWSSHDNLSGPMDDVARKLGYSPNEPTNRNLIRLLRATFGLALSDIYATNLFPFVKPGGMSDSIPEDDLVRAAKEFAIPQIDIVNPRLVICLGMVTFNALRIARGLTRAGKMEAALNSPFTIEHSLVWFQAHTGHFGQVSRNKGGIDRVSQDWLRMKSV